MNRHYLLFDADCPQCTGVAKRLRELGVSDLEVRSFDDPVVAELFAQAGRQLPGKPALVHTDGHTLTVRTGFGMRMQLARMLGARRAAEIAGLVALEVNAHLQRRTGGTRRMSRRTLLGGTAAIGAGALIFGAARPAAAQASPQPGAPLNAEAKERVLASTVVQQASSIWGEPEDSAIITAVTARGQNVALIPHRGGIGAFTVVTADEDDDGRLGVTIAFREGNDGLRYYLPSGTALAEQTLRGGELVTGRLDASAGSSSGEPEPQSLSDFINCFVTCIGIYVTPDCVLTCASCARGGWPALGYCLRCSICAGASAMDTVNFCKPLL